MRADEPGKEGKWRVVPSHEKLRRSVDVDIKGWRFSAYLMKRRGCRKSGISATFPAANTGTTGTSTHLRAVTSCLRPKILEVVGVSINVVTGMTGEA